MRLAGLMKRIANGAGKKGTGKAGIGEGERGKGWREGERREKGEDGWEGQQAEGGRKGAGERGAKRQGGVIYSLSCNPAPPRSHVNCREGEALELKIDILELLDWRSLRPACGKWGQVNVSNKFWRQHYSRPHE